LKVLLALLILGAGIAIGVWLALSPSGLRAGSQSWEQVRTAAGQLVADAGQKIRQAQLPSASGAAPGPGLLDRIAGAFQAFADTVGNLWVGVAKSIRGPG
jgi:hypothetical protein